MKHINIIAKSFNLDKKKIKANLKIENYNWDSMTKINLITNVNEKFSKVIDHTKLLNLNTFQDIDEIITKIIK